jgi:hypothetical protein
MIAQAAAWAALRGNVGLCADGPTDEGGQDARGTGIV